MASRFLSGGTSGATAGGGGWGQLSRGFRVQMQVIGALLMRELHTRYGRENIGYLWVIGEPLTLATAIALLHSGHSTAYAGDMRPLPFAVMGYCIFIMFRGIFGRSEGAMEANAPLMYHKMVTVFDIIAARALLEAAGTFLCLIIIMTLLVSVGLADPPERLLYLLAAVGFMFWFSFAMSMIVVAFTHENKLLGRLVHPTSYIMMPLSGAFYRVGWVPEPYQSYLLWFPLPHVFEMARYGYFRSADDQYFSFTFLIACCMVLSLIGLLAVKLVRKQVHLH